MKHTFFSRMGAVALTVWLGFAAGTANAIPTLQLGIAGGTYDWSTQTIVSTSPVFSLYAFLKPDSGNTLGDTYYLSMALTPQLSTTTNLGSFTYNGNTVNATTDMTYGTPPVEAFSAFDPGDLSKHGMFPTYFKEVGFSFSSASQSALFNTADHPSWGPQTGSGMYYKRFDIDTSNLASGYQIHFDMYNTAIYRTCSKKTGICTSDTDITQFAPFSHDAQSGKSVSPVPEPETYAMLLVGLGLIGFTARRRKDLDV